MQTGLRSQFFQVWLIFLLFGVSYTRGVGDVGGNKDKVEYVRLPLLTFVEKLRSTVSTTLRTIPTSTTAMTRLSSSSSSSSPSSPSIHSPVQFLSGREEEENENVAGGNWTDLRSMSQVINQLTHLVTGDDDGEDGSVEDRIVGKDEEQVQEEAVAHHEQQGTLSMEEEVDGQLDDGDEVGDSETLDEMADEDIFNELDLIELVQELERQADEEEQTGIFPEILDILHLKMQKGNNHSKDADGSATTSIIASSSTNKPDADSEWTVEEWPEQQGNGEENKNQTSAERTELQPRISLNADGDLELGSEDLSKFSEEIVDGISAGVEESLRMSDGLELDGFNFTSGDNGTAETRQFSVYLFQGQYYAEPRLNRFIDGALRNMGTELRVALMDPLYFRVLPRGRVAEREQPLIPASGVRRRRPGGGVGGGGKKMGVISGRQLKLPAFFRPNAKNQKKVQQRLRQQSLQKPGNRKKVVTGQKVTRLTNIGGTNIFLRRRRQQNRLQNQRRRRQKLRQQKLKRQQANRRKKQQLQNQQNKNNQNKQNQLLQRIRRRIKQDVGGGRIEGLSRVQRDGDAEMQLFGNYTLIRSHMKLGPVEITMQFRTKNGIRRSGATIPAVRAHTVTRVNHEGSEMIDYLLDRPTPEMIRVRGTLFPLAQRIARNIFARLFLPNSFLVSKLREKAALAYLSKPVAKRRRRKR